MHISPLCRFLLFWVLSELCSIPEQFRDERGQGQQDSLYLCIYDFSVSPQAIMGQSQVFLEEWVFGSSQTVGLGGSHPEVLLNSHRTYSKTRRKRNSQILGRTTFHYLQWPAALGMAKGFTLAWKYHVGRDIMISKLNWTLHAPTSFPMLTLNKEGRENIYVKLDRQPVLSWTHTEFQEPSRSSPSASGKSRSQVFHLLAFI